MYEPLTKYNDLVGKSIGLISHQLGGMDGVSILADQWTKHFTDLGCNVVHGAGKFHRNMASQQIEIRGLWAEEPWTEPPSLDTSALNKFGNSCEIIISLNVLTLPTAFEAADALAEMDKPHVVHHMDFHWESPHRPQADAFPLIPKRSVHSVMTSNASVELRKRRNITAVVIPPEADAAVQPYSTATISDKILVFHPVSIYPRKRIDRAKEFCAQLASQFDGDVTYWLTGAPPEQNDREKAFRFIGGRAKDRNHAYRKANLVILTSDWEGFGMPIVEAAQSRTLIACHDFPIKQEFIASGFYLLPLDPSEILGLSPSSIESILDQNLKAAQAYSPQAIGPRILDLATAALEI